MFYCIMLDTIWVSGWADFQVALMPLLVYLKASNSLIGIIQGASFACLIGNFLSPWISRRFKLKKWYLIITNIPYMAAIGIIGLGIVFSHRLGITDSRLLYFVVWTVLAHMFFAGFVAASGVCCGVYSDES